MVHGTRLSELGHTALATGPVQFLADPTFNARSEKYTLLRHSETEALLDC